MPHLLRPDAIGDDERLGHRIFDSKLARKCRKGNVPTRVFLGPKQSAKLSVDRLTKAPLSWFTELGDRSAATRLPEGARWFYGWAVVSLPDASRVGRRVVASPTLFNRYHADILLPIGVDDEAAWLRDALEHAEQLAEHASFEAPVRPDE